MNALVPTAPAAADPAGSDLADRLARLRLQAGGRSAAAGADPLGSDPPKVTRDGTAAPAAGRSVLAAPTRQQEADRLRQLLARRPQHADLPIPPRPLQPPRFDRELPGERIAPGLRYLECRLPCPSLPSQLICERPDADPIAGDAVLCFDTETTGLAGGSGTRAFMIGAADWRDGMLRIRQLYLDAMAGEAAMLDLFASWLDPTRVLVSYNGRSYDAPLLATRYRLARRANPLAGLAHLDLLYPVRRRYRGVWENCRLATIERELLGVHRHDDLPGAQAPAAWLQYLRGGSAALLRRVLQHNAQDLDSLARLLLALHAGEARS
jgi:uncharacterized protein